MKNEDALAKRFIDLEIDNIKQERELFKHVAIVSAAIVGMFVFNGKLEVSGLTQWALVGFIAVIFLSVVSLYGIIRLERKMVRLSMTALQDVKGIKNDFALSVLEIFANEEFQKNVQKKLQSNNIMELIGISSATVLDVYKKAQEGDDKIKEINKKLQNKKTVLVFTILSWICVGVFLGSLGCILYEIAS